MSIFRCLKMYIKLMKIQIEQTKNYTVYKFRSKKKHASFKINRQGWAARLQSANKADAPGCAQSHGPCLEMLVSQDTCKTKQ